MIRFACPRCQAPLSASEDCAGRVSRCRCGEPVTVPPPAVIPVAIPVAECHAPTIPTPAGAELVADPGEPFAVAEPVEALPVAEPVEPGAVPPEVATEVRALCARGDLRGLLDAGEQISLATLGVPERPPRTDVGTLLFWIERRNEVERLRVWFECEAAERLDADHLLKVLEENRDSLRKKQDRATEALLFTGTFVLAGLSVVSVLLLLLGVDVAGLGVGLFGYNLLALTSVNDEVIGAAAGAYAQTLSGTWAAVRLLPDLFAGLFIFVLASMAPDACQALACGLFRLSPEQCRSLLLSNGSLGELVERQAAFRASRLEPGRLARWAQAGLRFKGDLTLFALLALYFISIAATAGTGWHTYGYLLANAFIAVCAADVFFNLVAAFVKAGLTRAGIDTTESILDELIVAGLTVFVLLLAGMSPWTTVLVTAAVVAPWAFRKLAARKLRRMGAGQV